MTWRSSQPGMHGARRFGSRRKAQTVSREALTVKRCSKWGKLAPSPYPLPRWGRGILEGGEDALGGDGELGERRAGRARDGVHDGGRRRRHGGLADALGAEGAEPVAGFEHDGHDGRGVERGRNLVVEEVRVLGHPLLEDHLFEEGVPQSLNGTTLDLTFGALPVNGLADVVTGGELRYPRLSRLLVHFDLDRLRAEGVVVERLALPRGGVG